MPLTLALVDSQPLDADLTDIAALTPNEGDTLTYTSGHWTAAAPSGAATVSAARVTLTPSNLTDSVTLPAGAVLVDIIPIVVTLFDATTPLFVGDGDDASGYYYNGDASGSGSWFDGSNVVAGQSLDFSLAAMLGAAGSGQSSTYINASGGTPPSAVLRRYYAAGGSIVANIDASNTPTVGEVTITVLYAVPV